MPYFDLSLQHVSKPLLRRMRRWGDGDRFLRRIADIRDREPDAAFRSNFIVGYPGETEADHDQLLASSRQAQLDWCGFFAYSAEDGTYAVDLDGVVDAGLMYERLARAARAAGRHHRVADVTTLIGTDAACAGRRAGCRAQPPRGAGDRRRRRTCRHDRRGGRVRRRSRSSTRSAPISSRRASHLMATADDRSTPSKLATWANAVTVGRLLLVADDVPA